MRLFTILTIVSLVLVGCGKSGGGSSNSAESVKTLFSKWTNDAGQSIDLRGGGFGNSMEISTINFNTGAVCKAELTVIGDEKSGSYTILNAYWAGGGATDPGCASVNGGGQYDLANSILTICEGSNCVAYH
jgi:hypothetical protein